MVNSLGPPPETLLNRGSRSNLFFEKGVLKKELSELKTIEYFSKLLCERIPDISFRIFLETFLRWDPKERTTPLEALKSKWIIEGMPEHLRSSEIFGKDD